MSHPPYDIVLIDDDFRRAAQYYNAQMFGKGVDAHYADLKKEYEEHERLNMLVYMFAKQRHEYAGSVANPAYSKDNKVLNEVLTWLTAAGPSTPRRLFAHMELSEVSVPEWMTEIKEMSDAHVVPSLATIAALVQQAIATKALS